MDKDTNCLRVLLAKNASGRLIYCESCEVVELELGAMSLRIEAKELRVLAGLLQDANMRLAYFQQNKQQARSDASLAPWPLH